MLTLLMLSSWIFFWPLLASGLLLPGYLVGRIIGTPALFLSSFLGSAAILFYVVLGLDAAGVRLEAASIGGTVALIDLVLLGLVLLLRRPGASPVGTPSRPHGLTWLWLIPPALGLAAIAWRATADPLSGFDNVFRWDFLSRQMLNTGTLSFYPPMTSADFTLYGWCDGIPPLVSVLNLWSYVAAGSTAALATTPRVMLEAGLLFYAVWRLARGLWGADAGWPAVAALSTSALLLWGVALGQETGLTALTLVTMFVFLDEYRRGGNWACVFWAGLAAGAGALSREYALAWPFIGLVTLAWWGGLRTGWKTFLITAGLIAAPWYLRNWLHTGNPLFAQSVGGLFPTNPIHQEMMDVIGKFYRVGIHPEWLSFGAGFMVVLAGALGVLGLWGFCKAPRQTIPLGAAVLLVVMLWVWSIGQTAGGLVYSARVLTPALALAAVLAGGALASLKGSARGIAIAALAVISTDTAMRSLSLPLSAMEAPWELSPTRWLNAARELDQGRRNPSWKIIAEAAGPRAIVVDHPILQAMFIKLGAKSVTLFSPQAACMFDEKRSFSETIAQLKTNGVRFVLISNNPIMDDLVNNHGFLRALRVRKPVFTSAQIFLYDLDFIQP